LGVGLGVGDGFGAKLMISVWHNTNIKKKKKQNKSFLLLTGGYKSNQTIKRINRTLK